MYIVREKGKKGEGPGVVLILGTTARLSECSRSEGLNGSELGFSSRGSSSR